MQTDRIRGFALSPQQRRLWSLSGDKHIYRFQCIFMISGGLDLNALRAALLQVVSRHEVLHTTFSRVIALEMPAQVVHEKDDVSAYIDIEQRFMPSAKQEEAEASLFDSAAFFDLENGPLLSFILLTLSDNKHLLSLQLSPFCADPETLKNLLCEVADFYLGNSSDEDSPYEVFQYADTAEWMNEALQDTMWEAQREIWSKQATYLSIDLPFTRWQTPDPSMFRPQMLEMRLEGDLVQALQSLARAQASSLASILLASWVLLLARFSGLWSLLVGVQLSGRPYQELTHALGPYARSIPLLCHLSPAMRFPDLLQRIDSLLAEAQEVQLGFQWEQLAAQAAHKALPVFAPLAFDYQDWATSTGGLSDWHLQRWYWCAERFQLKLTGLQVEQQLWVQLYYDEYSVSLPEAQSLVGSLHQVLQEVGAAPQQVVSQLPLLDAQQRQQQVQEWNATGRELGPARSLPQVFEEGVPVWEDRVGVVWGEEHLSYGELNRRANQLAHYLREQGVGPEVTVGLLMERGVAVVIALLAVLKAGGSMSRLLPNYQRNVWHI